MHPVIRFRSRRFDLALERPNSINPIPGVSLLDWLRSRLPEAWAMSEPEDEDWGWCAYVDVDGRGYMLGACAFENPDGRHEWVLQFEKQRTFKERVFRRHAMSLDDPCLAVVRGVIADEAGFDDVTMDIDP